MREIASLQALVEEAAQMNDGWVFYVGDLDNLAASRFLVLTTEEDRDLPKKDRDGEAVPLPAYERGMKSLLDVATLQDVVDLRREAVPDATTAQMAEAIRHYVVEDDFLE